MNTALRLPVIAVGAFLGVAALVAAAHGTEARRVTVDDDAADDEEGGPARPAAGTPTPVGPPPAWADDAPAPVDAPQLRNVEPRTRIYLDGTFAQTPDLAALPHIAGSGRNYRLAFGGSLKLGRFQLDAELPASQATTVDLMDPDPSIVIADSDRHQTSLSIGDLRLGAQWTAPLPVDAMPLVAGLGIRLRAPTHTTRFQFFNLNDGSTITYALPYYFHIEPAVLLGGALGPLSFVMNQGAMILLGPDARLGDLPIVVPSLYFWDAHYALACRLVSRLAVSVEVNTTKQLNHVDGLDFQKLNGVMAVSVAPGLQVHLGAYRVDAVARFGLTGGSDLLGVLGYAGTRSFTLRVGRVFD